MTEPLMTESLKKNMSHNPAGLPRSSQVAPEPPGRRLLRALKSALAAAFGVQSNANRERDFQSDSIVPFVMAGVVVTIVLVVGLMALVSIVID